MINVNDAEIIATEAAYILEFFGADELLVDYENNKVGVQVSALTELMVECRNSTTQAVSDLRNAQLSYVHNYITKQVEKLDSSNIEIIGGASNLKVKYKGDVVFHFKISNRSSLSYIAIPGWELKPKTDVLDRIYDTILRVKDMIHPSLEIEKGLTNDKETVVEYPENSTLFNALKNAKLKDEPEEQPLQKQTIVKLDDNVDGDQLTRVNEIQEWISSVPQNLLLDTPIYENDEGEQWYLNEDLHGLIYQVLTLRNPDLRDHLSLKGNLLEYRIFDTARVSYELNIATLFSLYKMIDPAIDMIHNYLVSVGDRKVASKNIDILQKQNIAILSDRRSHSIRVEGLVIIRQELANILDNAELNDLSLEDVLIDIEESLPILLEKIDSLNINQSRHSMRRRQAELDRWDEGERSPRRL